MGLLDDDQWLREKWNELHAFHAEAQRHNDRATAREQDLAAIHREGWKNTANAITGGLRLIAEAIRDHGHR